MYLLDTHILLWWLMSPQKLTKQEYEIIENEKHTIYVSVATLWEIAIKVSLKKLKIPVSFREELEKLSFKILPIDIETAWLTKDLSFHHHDPFDRLIISTAKSSQLTLITHEKIFQKYDIKTV